MARATNLEEAIRVLDPQKSLDGETLNEFYVSRDSRSLKKIENLLKQAPPVKILFTGHRGTGKSTELARLQKDLDGFWTVRFSVYDKLDLNDLKHLDLFLTILLQILLKIEKSSTLRLSKNTLERAKLLQAEVEIEKTSTELTSVEVKVGLKESLLGLFSLEGRLSKEAVTRKKVREKIEPHLSELFNLLSEIVRDIESQLDGKRVLVIVEDIDKADLSVGKEIFYEHGFSMSQIPLSIIYTFPIALHSSEHMRQIEQNFGDCVTLANLKVRDRNGAEGPGVAQMMDLLEKRLESHLIEPDAQKSLILASGGIPRILLQLARDACNEALVDGLTVVRQADVDRAINEERKSFQRFLSKAQLRLLRDIYGTKTMDVGEEYARLLHGLSVFEYENGEAWFDVNPVVVKFLPPAIP